MDKFHELTGFLDNMLNLRVPGFDCMVYYKGHCVYRHMNGFSDLENKKPITGCEYYNLYSSTKLITCVAALQLYENRMFRLEDDLCDYMPEFKTMYVKEKNGGQRIAENKIKIKDLFCMTTGFSYDIPLSAIEKCRKADDGCPTRMFMKYYAEELLDFEPSTGWKYGFSHDVLAAFVEEISKKRFCDYVRENIFMPLGMKDTTFSLLDVDLNRMAQQYKYHPETDSVENVGFSIGVFKFGNNYDSGGGGAISTVEDYMKFLEAIRSYQLISRETTDCMTTDMLSEQIRNRDFFENENRYGYSWGLGIRCPRKFCRPTDFGWGGAAGSYYCIDIKNQITLFYSQHLLQSCLNDNGTVYSKLKLPDIVKKALL